MLMEGTEIVAIRNGLVQYIGALLKACGREGEEAMHIALAQLSEAWLECCKSEDSKGYSLFVAKPLMRACSVVLKSYSEAILEDTKGDEDLMRLSAPKIDELRKTASVLDELVSSIKREEE